MRLYYNVHYPNGDVKRHYLKHKDIRHPGLDKIFFNGSLCFQIEEMSEEDLWVKEINSPEYYRLLGLHETNNIFTCFVYDYATYILVEY